MYNEKNTNEEIYMIKSSAMKMAAFLFAGCLLFVSAAVLAAGSNGSEEEDAFGGIMQTCIPGILETKGVKESGENGARLVFELTLSDECSDDGDYRAESAWVYFSGDMGKTWNKTALTKSGEDRAASTEKWGATVALDDAGGSDESPIVYFFRAKDAYGNVSSELPLTSPGWPPDTTAYFSGVEDIDNSPEIIEDSLDILGSFVARDKENLYVIMKTQGDITPGTIDPPYYHAYVNKYTDSREEGEGLMVGAHHIFAPHILARSDFLFDFMKMMSDSFDKRVIEGCENIKRDRKQIYHTGINGNLLFTSVPMEELCPRKCESMRLIQYTAVNASKDTLLPIPLNSSHFLQVYFHAHVIGGDTADPVVSGDSKDAALTAPEGDYVFGDGPALFDIQQKYETHKYEGKGPFTVAPCDMISYKDYNFQVYTRNSRIKLRIFKDGKLKHTLMIGYDTKPRRDEQHQTDDIYITLSKFKKTKDDKLSCTLELKDLK